MALRLDPFQTLKSMRFGGEQYTVFGATTDFVAQRAVYGKKGLEDFKESSFDGDGDNTIVGIAETEKHFYVLFNDYWYSDVVPRLGKFNKESLELEVLKHFTIDESARAEELQLAECNGRLIFPTYREDQEEDKRYSGYVIVDSETLDVEDKWENQLFEYYYWLEGSKRTNYVASDGEKFYVSYDELTRDGDKSAAGVIRVDPVDGYEESTIVLDEGDYYYQIALLANRKNILIAVEWSGSWDEGDYTIIDINGSRKDISVRTSFSWEPVALKTKTMWQKEGSEDLFIILDENLKTIKEVNYDESIRLFAATDERFILALDDLVESYSENGEKVLEAGLEENPMESSPTIAQRKS